MNIRNEIKRILKEELASLVNPLDATTDSIALNAKGFNDKVAALKDRVSKEKKDLSTDVNAKKKAIMVPQSNEPSVERQRRQYDNLKIKDLQAKLKAAEEQEKELEALQSDINNMSGSLKDLELQKQELQNAIAKLNGQGG